MAACPALSTGDAFLSTLLSHIDCQGRTIGASGYQALADPGSPLALVLTTVLTLFIALFGLRMVMGETPTVRDGVMAIVKIGVVLVIATSWPAYRTVFYDVVVDGPNQIGAAIAGPARLPGGDGDLIARLQTADNAITQLITLGSGRQDLTSREPVQSDGSLRAPQRNPIADDPAMGSARVLFLAGTVSAFAVVRLMAGILLALAPLFAGLLLFDMARGLFVGWVRALGFTLLASLAVTLILSVELALLEPWLAQVLQLRQARVVTAAAPIEMLVMALAFALALPGALGLCLRLAFMLHLPRAASLDIVSNAPAESLQPAVGIVTGRAADPISPRALATAGALAAAQRRESRSHATLATGSRTPPNGGAYASAQSLAAAGIVPIGQAARRTKLRASLGAARRDRRS